MDTESDQKARRFTKLAWCERRKDNPRKKVSRRSQKAGQAGAESKASPDPQEIGKVAPYLGVLLFGMSLIFSALIILWS